VGVRFPELTRSQRAAVAGARLVSNPGCYPTGFLAAVRPLRECNLLAADHAVAVHAVSGYSGGGRKMIEAFEQPGGTSVNFGVYGLNLAHKHVPEMQMHGLLDRPPIFAPSVGRFRRAACWSRCRRHRATAERPNCGSACGLR
jgi:N-acetyl-gamma-glutamyl-phosphate reductase